VKYLKGFRLARCRAAILTRIDPCLWQAGLAALAMTILIFTKLVNRYGFNRFT
jgi:hypothetical protein